MIRSWPTVKIRFFSSSTSMPTIECLASKKVASDGRSVSFSVVWHVLQTLTSYSKPMIGMLIRFGEQLSQIALPQFLCQQKVVSDGDTKSCSRFSPAMVLTIDAERFLFKHCLQIPEKRLGAELACVGFHPVGSSFSHAVDLLNRHI
jgi:hypothetical protein